MWIMKSSLNCKQFVSPADRKIQDYRSAYNDIRDWQRREKEAEKKRNQPLTGMT